MKKSDLVLTLGQRLLLLLFTFIICYMLTIACSFVLGRVLSGNVPAALRISALAQDVIAFILPAVITALLVTRKPAELLCLTQSPKFIVLLLVAISAIVSTPLQEDVIYWNYNIVLPESMKEFETLLRDLEAGANTSLILMLGDGSVSSLILNILVVGVAAAFAEELLFRGCFQRLLTTAGVNGHVAIWIVAFCFSAMHMQFFGFVPRLLLGAYFGYLLMWTKSLWVPVAAHMLNNVMYVVLSYREIAAGRPEALSEEPKLWSLAATLLSVSATAAVLVGIYKLSNKKEN